MEICSANVTSYNTAVSSWLATRLGEGTRIIAIQETHQGETANTKTRRLLQACGLEGNFLPAADTGRGGTTGGQFVAAARALGVHTLAAYNQNGNGWCGILLEQAGSKLALFSIYLKTGESVLGPTNCHILGALRGCLKTLADGLPWIVVGDWNAEPSALGESGFVKAVSGSILDSGEATFATSASNLDYAVVHSSLAGLVSLQVDWEVPWRPHAALRLRLAWQHLRLLVPKLKAYKDVPLLEGPRLPWSTFELETVQLCNELVCPRQQFCDEELSHVFGAWMAQAEGWLKSVETDVDPKDLGRGVHVAIEMQPLAMPEVVEGRFWKHPSLEFWQTLSSWVETFQRHKGCYTPVVKALNGRLFQLIVRAAAKVETWWVELDELHYTHAWKLQTLLFRIGTLSVSVLSRVVHDVSMLKKWFLKSFLHIKAEEWACTVQNMVKGSGRSAFALFGLMRRLKLGRFRHWP